LIKGNEGGLVLDLDGEAIGIELSSDALSFASIKNITDASDTPLTPPATPAVQTP